uniref:Uncharacterized protein n=1 Tax=Tetranychus urticae TaxID=32264 RepID=T1KDV7_TETUR
MPVLPIAMFTCNNSLINSQTDLT